MWCSPHRQVAFEKVLKEARWLVTTISGKTVLGRGSSRALKEE